MNCEKCGNSIPAGLSACPHCGAPVEDDDVINEAAEATEAIAADDVTEAAETVAETDDVTEAAETGDATEAIAETDDVTRALTEDESATAVLPTEASVFQPQADQPLKQEDPMAQAMGTATPPKKTGGNGKAIAIIVIAVIVAAAIGVGAWLISKNKKNDDNTDNDTTVSQEADSTGENDATKPDESTEPANPDDTTEAPSDKDDTSKPADANDTTKPGDTDDTTEKPDDGKPTDSKPTDKDDTTGTTKKPKTTDPVKPADGKPDPSSYRIARYKDIFASKQFLMEMTVEDDSADISGPIKLATKNDNVYISASMEGMDAVIIYQADTKKSYMLMPQMKIYTEMTEDVMGDSSISDLFDLDALTGSFNEEMTEANIKTSTKKIDGKSLYCESVTTKDGITTNYYFDGDDLVLIENLDGHESESRMKITKLTDEVPDSLFQVPKGYVYMDLNALGGLLG